MNKKYNRIISTFFTILLLQIFICNAHASELAGREQKPEAGIYVFVSFTMNDAALRSYFEQSRNYGAKLVMRSCCR